MAKKSEDTSSVFAFIIEKITELQGQIVNMREEMNEGFASIRLEMATKMELESVREEIMSELHPLSRAVDKDAVAILDHEKRITRLETQAT